MGKHEDDGDDEHLLVVASRGELALNKPRFIVKAGDKYFLTFGAWEYEPARARNGREKSGCREIKELFEQSPKVEAADVPASLLGPTIATATRPHKGFAGNNPPDNGDPTDPSTTLIK